jgi:hypothetical protein
VAQACRGVVFLGAAHRETGQESFGQIAVNAAAVVVQPSLLNEIRGKLEGSSDAFDRINESFINYMEKRKGDFKAVTFYDQMADPAIGKVNTTPLYIFHYVLFPCFKGHYRA